MHLQQASNRISLDNLQMFTIQLIIHQLIIHWQEYRQHYLINVQRNLEREFPMPIKVQMHGLIEIYDSQFVLF